MNKDFPRIITLLREEKGLSQKRAASDLGISQPLLTHYEKGIRECSLDFVVKAADYYGVTCDYLLGRSVSRTANAGANNYNEDDLITEDTYTGSSKISPIVNFNKRTVFHSLTILFDQIDRLDNIGLIHECSSYLFGSVYTMFRTIYSSNPKNPKGIFSVPEHTYKGRVHAMQSITESNTESITHGLPISEYRSLDRTKQVEMSPETIEEQYSAMSESLFTLIQSTEKRMMK